MDYLENHPWRQSLLNTVVNDIGVDIVDEHPDWIYLDGEMVKLGSLEHELLDIEKVQKIAIKLLSTESKDLRILAHLLRTLQHSGQILDLLLGLQLFADYVEHFWQQAAPVSEMKKYRLGLQIIKRFDKGATQFRQNSSRLEREAAETLFEKLSQYLKGNKLATEIDALRQVYLLNIEQTNKVVLQTSNIDKNVKETVEKTTYSASLSAPIEVDVSNERAWKNTLLKVVEYLSERDVTSPVVYQLRRYVLWSGITSLPIAEDCKTPLAPPSQDRVSIYEMALEHPTLETLQNIEHSLTVAPFWFYGHYLSAQMAEKLGHYQISIVIKNALNEFLTRLPQLSTLCFNDGSEFCPKTVLDWLSPKENVVSSPLLALDNLEDNNFDALLMRLNDQGHTDLRNQFYNQLFLAQQLEKRGLLNLARQYYLTIDKAIENLSVKEWEQSLVGLLTEKLE
ncbi:type VI secretion system ImpA domain-containing protein [Rodentibacter rarus]|uniref:type VI secretion system protein TssA n=1 Tax=Rodentibacter rarus TaxID=1908260 RepID=UPI000984FCF2|nr:type VI secretion system protein TssA [Rodentibacter rarus]OOF42780.1 type VI secretion system ImpA domain-containing protein [Rodentibacter rarus]